MHNPRLTSDDQRGFRSSSDKCVWSFVLKTQRKKTFDRLLSGQEVQYQNFNLQVHFYLGKVLLLLRECSFYRNFMEIFAEH